MRPGDGSVSVVIAGLPVELVLPERDIEAMLWMHRAARILREGRGEAEI